MAIVTLMLQIDIAKLALSPVAKADDEDKLLASIAVSSQAIFSVSGGENNFILAISRHSRRR